MRYAKIRSIKRVRRRRTNGSSIEILTVEFEDNRIVKFRDMQEVPAELLKAIENFESTIPENQRVEATNLGPRNLKRSVRGGDVFGTRWKANRDNVEISWPTIPLSPLFGIFGLLLVSALAMGAFLLPEKQGDRWSWIIAGAVLSIVLLISSRLLREKFSMNRKHVTLTRWPAFANRPRLAVPLKSVINAVVQLDIFHGEHTRRVGTVQLRLKRADGIDWWEIGSDLNWSHAESLGRLLSRYIPVRVEHNDE